MRIARTREKLGKWAGYALGVATGTTSLVRRSRMFHPRGVTYSGKVVRLGSAAVVELPSYALLRFSSAWWKGREWPDVLGVAVRFSDSAEFTETAREGDQDLLFATIKHPVTMAFAPLTTRWRDFLSNHYFAVSPFAVSGGKRLVKFSLVPLGGGTVGRTRGERLKRAVERGEAKLELRVLDLADRARGWQAVARIELSDEVKLNQEGLRFNPFRAGRGIEPKGFVHALRIGTYRLSQGARPGAPPSSS